MITAIELRELLSYNPHTGVFKWRDNDKVYPRVRGKVAGSVGTGGYRKIKINDKTYMETHLVWLYHTGYFPEYEIDHINNVRDDNRLINLREVTHQQNQLNRIDTKRNGGVYKGSHRHRADQLKIYYKNREARLAYQRVYDRKKKANDK